MKSMAQLEYHYGLVSPHLSAGSSENNNQG